MAAQQDKDQSQQRITELEDEIQNYRVYYRYTISISRFCWHRTRLNNSSVPPPHK